MENENKEVEKEAIAYAMASVGYIPDRLAKEEAGQISRLWDIPKGMEKTVIYIQSSLFYTHDKSWVYGGWSILQMADPATITSPEFFRWSLTSWILYRIQADIEKKRFPSEGNFLFFLLRLLHNLRGRKPPRGILISLESVERALWKYI